MPAASVEADLIRRASQGDECAFVTLYERHRTPMFRFAYRLVGSAQIAEEITHDCFIALIRKPNGYRPERASLRTYLFAAVRNLAYRHIGRRRFELPVVEIPDRSDDEPTAEPLSRVLGQEVVKKVREAVMALPPLQREALVLFEYERMSLAGIAEITGVEVGTVKSRLHRARGTLRKTLARWASGGAVKPRGRQNHDEREEEESEKPGAAKNTAPEPA